MMEKVPERETGACITIEQLDKLASKDLNGREIKNTTRTAQTLSGRNYWGNDKVEASARDDPSGPTFHDDAIVEGERNA